MKGDRTCLGSVLNKGKAKVVMHQTISDMIASVELQRPGGSPTMGLRHCAREASFKHLTLKTVFLLAMASARRRSELQALTFDQNYIQFKPKGAGVILYFSQSEFGAPNCPVRALCYYYRHLTEHLELGKDRRRPFVPIKDNNAGKELSASTISRWICTTIVDSHAAIQNSRNLSGSAKAYGKSGGYIVTAFQQGRPSFCHKGRKMLQWWHLHFLLPQRSLPSS